MFSHARSAMRQFVSCRRGYIEFDLKVFVSVIKRSVGYDVYDVKCVTYVRTWNKENLMQIGCYRHIMPLAAANHAKLN